MSEPSSSDVLRFVEATEKWRALSAERVRIRNAIATAVEERDRIASETHIKFLGDGTDYVAGFRGGQRCESERAAHTPPVQAPVRELTAEEISELGNLFWNAIDRITCQDTSVRAVIARYHEMLASEVAE